MRTVHVGEQFTVALRSLSQYYWVGPKALPSSIKEIDQTVQLRPDGAGTDQQFGFLAQDDGVFTLTFSYMSAKSNVACVTHNVDVQVIN